MTETLTLTPEQKAPTEANGGGLAQLALEGALSTAGQVGFTLSEEIEAELRTLFEGIDPSAPPLPLSAHGLGCDIENSKHVYLLPGYKVAAE